MKGCYKLQLVFARKAKLITVVAYDGVVSSLVGQLQSNGYDPDPVVDSIEVLSKFFQPLMEHEMVKEIREREELLETEEAETSEKRKRDGSQKDADAEENTPTDESQESQSIILPDHKRLKKPQDVPKDQMDEDDV
ncbi:hypothetical protein HDU76_011606 [Blyttiomyces sp. JEL0837]|nr:hypothetical protein HDU76_011606 [Blyttiomyces sp. JEL0837]